MSQKKQKKIFLVKGGGLRGGVDLLLSHLGILRPDLLSGLVIQFIVLVIQR
jgi:hypothetical protein